MAFQIEQKKGTDLELQIKGLLGDKELSTQKMTELYYNNKEYAAKNEEYEKNEKQMLVRINDLNKQMVR